MADPDKPKPYTGEVVDVSSSSQPAPYAGEVQTLSPAQQIVEQVAGGAPAEVASSAPDFARWLRTRAINAATGVLTTARSMNDLNRAIAEKTAEFFGASPETQKTVGGLAAWANPLTAGANLGPNKDTMREATRRTFDIKDVNAPERWGVGGKMLDAGTEAVMGSLVGGPSGIVRNIVPAAVGGAASEGAGNIPGIKDTPWELPVRTIAGLLGGVGTGLGQNMATSTIKGTTNILGSDLRNAELQAARILGRERLADQQAAQQAAEQAAQRAARLAPPGSTLPPLPPLPTMAETHAQFLPGTPLAATFPQGGNQAGAVRGAVTLKGPARTIVNEGEKNFRESADARVAPVLDQIGGVDPKTGRPLPPAEVRVPQLMDEARQNAPPIYRQAGVADLPQQILQTQPGAPITTRVPSIGPAPFVERTTSGPPVTTGVATNSPILQSPALRDFIDQSGIVQQAINRTRELSAFKREPLTSMTMLDKVYKDLGSMEGDAGRDTGRARDIRMERQKLAQHIENENPVYGRALQAYADPASLADAATLGKTLAKQNLPPEDVARQFQALESDAHRREFLGGFAGELRGKSGGTDRATPAERFWNSDYTRGKVQAIFGLPPGQYGPDLYEHINTLLENERQAARTLRDITKGSTTANKIVEGSNLAGGDVAGTVSDVLHHGVRGAMVAKALEWMGAASGRTAEGRTQAVNAALARMAMQTNPADIVRTQGLVATAQQQAAATAAARRGSYSGGATGGLLGAQSAVPQMLGPADRIMQGLLMGGG